GGPAHGTLRSWDEVGEQDVPSDRVMESLPDRALRQCEPDDIGEVPEAFRGEFCRPLVRHPWDGGEAADGFSVRERRIRELHGRAARVAGRNPAFERLVAGGAHRLFGTEDRVAPRTHRFRRPEPADEAPASHRERSSPSRLKRCFIIISGDRKSTRLNSSHQIISYAVF